MGTTVPQLLGTSNAHQAPETFAVCMESSAIKQEIADCQQVNQVTNKHNPAPYILPFFGKTEQTKEKPKQKKPQHHHLAKKTPKTKPVKISGTLKGQ